MTFGKILLLLCIVFFIVGTIGLVRNIKDKRHSDKVRKQYIDANNQK